MDKGIITIGVDKNTTEDEIKEIRERFKEEGWQDKGYCLNIIISGEEDMKLSLSRFLAARLKA